MEWGLPISLSTAADTLAWCMVVMPFGGWWGDCPTVCVCVREGGGREGERIKISHSVLHNKLDLLQIKLASFLLSSCRLLTSYDMKELDGIRPGNTARQNLHYINTSSHKAKSNATT